MAKFGNLKAAGTKICRLVRWNFCFGSIRDHPTIGWRGGFTSNCGHNQFSMLASRMVSCIPQDAIDARNAYSELCRDGLFRGAALLHLYDLDGQRPGSWLPPSVFAFGLRLRNAFPLPF
jgi:hypothetical protein